MSVTRRNAWTFATFADFLDWERRQETKHELVDGEPVAMAGASEGHNIIQGNMFASVRAKLPRGNPGRVFMSNMAVQTGVNMGRYPDATIDCGPPNPANRSAPKPTVVLEVLSPETQKEDRKVKLAEYNAVSTIAHYVLVEQSGPLVHIYSRGESGDFIIRPLEIGGLDGSFELPAVGISLSMADIYESLDYGTNVKSGAPIT